MDNTQQTYTPKQKQAICYKLLTIGSNLRTYLLTHRNENANALHGRIYRLESAAHLNDIHNFKHMVFKLYFPTKQAIPVEFGQIFQNPELFSDGAYAFIIGLGGGVVASAELDSQIKQKKEGINNEK